MDELERWQRIAHSRNEALEGTQMELANVLAILARTKCASKWLAGVSLVLAATLIAVAETYHEPVLGLAVGALIVLSAALFAIGAPHE